MDKGLMRFTGPDLRSSGIELSRKALGGCPHESKVMALFLFCYANHVGERQEFIIYVANN